MKRFFLLLLLAQSAVAGPKLSKVVHVVTNHVTLGIVAGASSGFQAGGTQWCGTHNPDVEGCTAHYGSGTGVSIVNGVLTGGMIALSEYGRNAKFKEWFLPEVAVTGFNIFWGTRQFRTHEKAADIPKSALRFHP